MLKCKFFFESLCHSFLLYAIFKMEIYCLSLNGKESIHFRTNVRDNLQYCISYTDSIPINANSIPINAEI